MPHLAGKNDQAIANDAHAAVAQVCNLQLARWLHNGHADLFIAAGKQGNTTELSVLPARLPPHVFAAQASPAQGPNSVTPIA